VEISFSESERKGIQLSRQRTEMKKRPAEGGSLSRQERTALDGGKFFLQRLPGNSDVIRSLPAQAPAFAQAKVAEQAKVGICRDSAFASDDFTNPLCPDAHVLCEAALC